MGRKSLLAGSNDATRLRIEKMEADREQVRAVVFIFHHSILFKSQSHHIVHPLSIPSVASVKKNSAWPAPKKKNVTSPPATRVMSTSSVSSVNGEKNTPALPHRTTMTFQIKFASVSVNGL